MSCHRVNQIFICDSFGVLSKQFNNTCFGALYMQQFKEAQTLCPFMVLLVEERVYQLWKGHFIAYLLEQITVNIACRDGKASELHLSKGSQQVRIPPRCTGIFPHHLVTSDFSVKLNHSIVHYKWHQDPFNFLPADKYHQMEETLKHVGELRLHQPDLSDLQYLTRLGSLQDTSALGSLTSAWAFQLCRVCFRHLMRDHHGVSLLLHLPEPVHLLLSPLTHSPRITAHHP